MDDGDTINFACPNCGALKFTADEDGYFYCVCGYQADDIVDTGVADEDFIDKSTRGAVYQASHRRATASTPIATVKTEPSSQFYSQSQLWSSITQLQTGKTPKKEEHDVAFNAHPISAVGPTEPEDFALAMSYENCHYAVRMRYVLGLQLMMQLQCEALVDKCTVSPLILGFSGPIWMRFLASTRVFDDEWADDCIQESELQIEGEPEKKRARGKEPRNIHGKRGIMIWYRTLKKSLPLTCSLAISYLACHIAREPVLPTDIMKWSTEGKLPYFAAFTEIEENIGKPSHVCPLSSSIMFRPSETISPQKLESLAASIAEAIGLELPPVNFHAIASLYLGKLSLPEDKILSHACKLQIWATPPDLWLSTNELRLPTRVCVMSILIVTLRILYNIHGFGEWEKGLEEKAARGRNDEAIGTGSSDLTTKELLQKFYAAIFDDVGLEYEFSEDLPTYLKYCKDVVFAGLEPGFEDNEEGEVIKLLWDFYETNKDAKPAEDGGFPSRTVLNRKHSRENSQDVDEVLESPRTSIQEDQVHSFNGEEDPSQFSSVSQNIDTSAESLKHQAMRRLKMDMEENRFTYIPPRVKVKKLEYLHYERKRDDGSLVHVAHADYYILLRACARVAEVDVRIMHLGVLGLERRLAWLEKGIERCLHVRPPKVSCTFCKDDAIHH